MLDCSPRRCLVLLWMAIAMSAFGLVGCGESYSQSSPDAVLKSLEKMVKAGEVERVSKLLYAENPEMRALLTRLGKTLGSLQEVSEAIARKYPGEVAAIKARAEEAAKNGEAAGLIARMMPERGRGKERRSRQEQEDRMKMLFQELFADPYGWIANNQGRLTTVEIADDMAAIQWDGKPILPPIGMVMKKDGGKWFIVLPTNVPGLSTVMPRNDDEFKVFGKLLKVFDNALADVKKDVDSGACASLDDVAALTGRKIFPAMMLAFIAYGNLIEEREREAREQKKAEQAAEAAPEAPPAEPANASPTPEGG